MKRILCAMLALCMLCTGLSALALTGAEALGIGGSGTGKTSDGSYPVLRKGSKDKDGAGAYVVMLQNRLAELGYLSSAADGGFGAQTETALINFQEANDLTPTGIADGTTQSVLYSDTAKRAQNRTAGNNQVLRVQQAMTRWGFMTATPDGLEGDDTATAVAQFKNYIATYPEYKNYTTPTPEPAETLAPGEQPVALDQPLVSEISVNGHSGEITDEVIKFVEGEYKFRLYRKTVKSGSEGDEVWRVQRRLRQLRYLYKPDGTYGSLTKLAVRAFQTKNGLKATGIADEATQKKLFSANAKQSKEYVFPYKIKVSLKKQRVYIYGWNGKSYGKKVGSCKCSTGRPGFSTPKGTYQSGGKCTVGPWYYFKQYGEYAKYATRIVGGVLFHSVLYNHKGGHPTSTSVRNLGSAVSHGCVRLAVKNAKWIFEHCPEGTTVVIY